MYLFTCIHIHKYIPYVVLFLTPEWTCELVLLQLKHTEVISICKYQWYVFVTRSVIKKNVPTSAKFSPIGTS